LPGISFIFDSKNEIIKKESEILQSLKSIIHTEQYKHEIFLDEKSFFLGCTRYDEYPVKFFETDEFYICLEGQIYNKNSKLKSSLVDLAKMIVQNKKNMNEELAKWLLDTDGDFVIVIKPKNRSRIYIINDVLGRLPLYYYKRDGKLFVSREMQFIINLIEDNKFDRMAIAQYLLFGYSLGKRTLFEDINRLKPASIIKIDLKHSDIKFDDVYQFNFDQKKNAKISFKENIKNLVELFTEACKNRTNSNDKNIVTLSGGLDSRTVAAGLHRNKIPFFGATYMDFNKTAESDVRIAKELADVFNIQWKLFSLNPPQGKDILELLKIKNGLNYLGMGFIIPFYKNLIKTYGSNIIIFSGDGGDKVLPDLRPSSNPNNLNDLVNNVITDNQIYSLNDVAALTKIDKQEIISELKQELQDYPEQDLKQKYIHFLVFERGFKWLFEGEDRNRFYFWSTSPFYSVKFFNYAMNCPDNMKNKYKLYREFLIELSPDASEVEYANWKLPITSSRTKLYLFYRDIYFRLPHKITKLFRRKYKKVLNLDEDKSEKLRCFREQIKNRKLISKYFSTTEIKKMKNITYKEYYNLFTLISVIEEFENTKSTIEKYSDTYFS
jgi:asparagine synthase (glutamine-hydrolysing)